MATPVPLLVTGGNAMEAPSLRIPGRTGAVASRRASLRALAGAALAGSGRRSPAEAAKKSKNRRRTTTKARAKCQTQVAACREQFRAFCQDDRTCAAATFPCCDPLEECQADETLECAYAYLEQ
jgi:hypothetical protein